MNATVGDFALPVAELDNGRVVAADPAQLVEAVGKEEFNGESSAPDFPVDGEAGAGEFDGGCLDGGPLAVSGGGQP